MRDKALSIITLTSIFSLFLYYKMTPENSPVKVVEHNTLIPENEIVIDVIEDGNMEKVNIEVEIEEEVCILNENQTDQLSFSDAFKYFRDCLGKDETFSWNSNVYSTLLSSEVEEINIAVHNSNQADKNHLDLQNEILGNHSE